VTSDAARPTRSAQGSRGRFLALWQAVWLIAVLAIIVAMPWIASAFWLGILRSCAIAVIGALALNILIGYTGQISLGHGGLMALGAFSAAYLTNTFDMPFVGVLIVASALGGIVGLIAGLPGVRLRGLYLAVTTLGVHFAVIAGATLYQSKVAMGTGFRIPSAALGPWQTGDGRVMYYVLMLFAAAVTVFTANLLRSRVGRAWIAVRDRDLAAEAMGVHAARTKVEAFVLTSALTALAGALLAYNQRFVSVEAFSFSLTIQYLAMVIIGGMASIPGSILGAFFITLLPPAIEWLVGVIPTPDTVSTQLFYVQEGLFAVLLLVFLYVEPRGLVGLWPRLRAIPSRLRKRGRLPAPMHP